MKMVSSWQFVIMASCWSWPTSSRVASSKFATPITALYWSCYRAKYPLAVVNKLIDCFGSNLAAGYDINCSFAMTLFNSTVGPCALLSNHTSLVGAFHGHAHCRLCQLKNLATYIYGLGLEDLETCERTFSKSNMLAAMTRHASVFHRQQAILMYFAHNDEHEVYSNLCTSYEERASLITNAYFSKVPGCELSSGTRHH